MRIVTVLLVALLSIVPALAYAYDFTVDPSYATTSADSNVTIDGRFDRTSITIDYAKMDIGRFRLAPSVRIRQESARAFVPLGLPTEMNTVEIGFAAYTPERPRLMFVMKYLYRRAHKQAEEEDAFGHRNPLRYAGYEPSADTFSIGWKCTLPLNSCLAREKDGH